MCLIIWCLVHVCLVQFLLAMSPYFLALFTIPLLCLSFSVFFSVSPRLLTLLFWVWRICRSTAGSSNEDIYVLWLSLTRAVPASK